MKTLKHFFANPYIVLILGAIFLILGSPKWTIALAPWLGYALMLYFTRARKVKIWKTTTFGFLALFLSGVIAMYDVIPAPAPLLVIIIFIGSMKSILPFLLDRWSKAGERGFIGTLIFPAAFVTIEFISTLNRGDTWASVANTQYSLQSFQQIASVFGIWGISFLVYWFASLTNWFMENDIKLKPVRRGLVGAISVYVIVFLFGIIRISGTDPGSWKEEGVKVAGVTIENITVIETLYSDEFGESIDIPVDVSQTSPILQEANRAMVPFIEGPFVDKYDKTHRVLGKNLDELFSQSANAADNGARIVVWSEGIGMVFDRQEEEVIQRGRELAKGKNMYLVMGLAVVNPGPVTQDRLLMVNKTVTINPDGNVENTYLKSNPVPFAEQDYGSDGVIPIIETPYGKLSPVICYDADFPLFMKQTGENETDILVVPSGDWKAIDPYHPYMARLRGIENGTSVVRPVSRATSIVTDPYGNVLASNDFYSAENKSFEAIVPTKGIDTIYNHIGDVLAYLSVVVTVYYLLEMVVLFFRRKLLMMGWFRSKTVGTAS